MPKNKKRMLRLLRLAATLLLMVALMLNTTYGYQGTVFHENEFSGEKEPDKEIPSVKPGKYISVKVTKVWEAPGSHPETVTAQLYRNGSPSGKPVTLSNSNSWEHVWTGLAKDNTWTVDELNVPEGYTKTVTGTASAGFVITNSKDEDPEPPDTTEEIEDPEPPEASKETDATETPEPSQTPENPKVTETPDAAQTPATPDASQIQESTQNQPEKPGEEDNGLNIHDPGIPGEGYDQPNKGNFEFPKTGDDMDPRPWLMILAISTLILRHILFFRKKKNSKPDK